MAPGAFGSYPIKGFSVNKDQIITKFQKMVPNLIWITTKTISKLIKLIFFNALYFRIDSWKRLILCSCSNIGLMQSYIKFKMKKGQCASGDNPIKEIKTKVVQND